MNIELENLYTKWDDSLTHAEGYVFDNVSELTELLQNCEPIRVHPSGVENHPFNAGPGKTDCIYFYKVRDVEVKGYIVHEKFKPELLGKAGIFCDNLEDIEEHLKPVNFVPLVLKDRGTNNFPFSTGRAVFRYFIETSSLIAFPDDICPLQPGDIIREKTSTLKYMIIGTDEDQCSSHHVLVSNSWLSNTELFNKFYKVTDFGDSVIGVMEQPETDD